MRMGHRLVVVVWYCFELTGREVIRNRYYFISGTIIGIILRKLQVLYSRHHTVYLFADDWYCVAAKIGIITIVI